MTDAPWVGPLVGFVGLGTFFANGGRDGLSGWEWFAVVLAVLAGLVLLLRRTAPELTLVLIGLLVGSYLALGFSDGPIYLPLLVGCFVVAQAAPHSRWLPWCVAAVGASLVGFWIRAAVDDARAGETLGRTIVIAALTATAATLGSLVRSRAQTRRERAARVSTEEQLRMAQDLHDGVGHGLAVIAMQAGVALHVLERDPASARSALEAIRDASRESLESLREELARLSGGAPRTPRLGVEDLAGLAQRVGAAGLEVTLTGTDRSVPDPVGHAVYLIAQEALTNVLRHARARSAEVGIQVDDRVLTLRVVDDGVGAVPYDEGMGITGMRRRVEALGGTLWVRPRPGAGFEVRAELPL